MTKLLNPDMRSDQIRLHMGELTADEVLVARAAIRWANSAVDVDKLIAEIENVDTYFLGIRVLTPELATSIIRKHIGKE